MKLLIASTVITATLLASAPAGAVTDKQIVDITCSREARIAHCGPAQVGTGLLRCFQANPFVRLSSACKAAIGQFERDKQATFVNPLVVIRPTSPIPGPGYIWRFHPAWGWGWYHPRFGWYRDWR